jgi:molybdopterin converting factor subunit 1
MRIRVRFFAALRDLVGEAETSLVLGPGATVEEAWAHLVRDHPELAPRRRSLAAARNRRYVAFDEPLAEGDELVFIPPVSGG